MPAYYYDSNSASNGDGLTSSTPKNTMAGAAFTNSNNIIYVKCGSDFNLTSGVITNAGYESNRLIFTSYGTGEKPIIRSYIEDDGTGWYEVSPNGVKGLLAPYYTGGDLFLEPGSNLWWKGGIGNRMLLGTGNRWAAQRNADNNPVTGYGRKLPTEAYQSSPKAAPSHTDVPGATISGALLWSVGNPLTYYGRIRRQPPSAGGSGLLNIINPTVGGLSVSGIDFRETFLYPVYYNFASYTTLCGPISYVDNSHQDTMGQISFAFWGTQDVRNNIGTRKFTMTDNVGVNLGHGGLHCWGQVGTRAIFNNAKVQRNVINGACKVMSLGAIYLLNMGSNEGPPIDVSYNCVNGSEYGNVWEADGYAIYGDFQLENVNVHHNYVWDCKYTYRFNGATGQVEFNNNVGIARSDSDRFVGSNNPNDVADPCKIDIHHNIAIGYKTFFDSQDIVAGSSWKIHHNISKATTSSPQPAVDTQLTANYTVDRNNFYGHSIQWRDWDATPPADDHSSSATNQITSDPTALLDSAIIQNPTDPLVNYALTLPTSFNWETTPGLSSAPLFNKA